MSFHLCVLLSYLFRTLARAYVSESRADLSTELRLWFLSAGNNRTEGEGKEGKGREGIAYIYTVGRKRELEKGRDICDRRARTCTCTYMIGRKREVRVTVRDWNRDESRSIQPLIAFNSRYIRYNSDVLMIVLYYTVRTCHLWWVSDTYECVLSRIDLNPVIITCFREREDEGLNLLIHYHGSVRHLKERKNTRRKIRTSVRIIGRARTKGK